MIVGIPKETKEQEARVALTPEACAVLTRDGHQVLVQRSAGLGSGFGDDQYAEAGAAIAEDLATVYGAAELIVKVKAPTPPEYPLLRSGQVLLAFLHLVGEPALTDVLLERRTTALDYETVQQDDGSLPLLAPTSQIAGHMAMHVAAHLLERPSGGLGKLLGGAAGAAPCHLVVLGGGTSGTASAQMAVAMGARVTMLTRRTERLLPLVARLGPALTVVVSTPDSIEGLVPTADVVVAAAAVPGETSPRLVSRRLVAKMAPGSVIVCINADDAGVVETCRHTTHADPTFVEEGVIHYCVPNMPAAVPVTASEALSTAVLPYLRRLADLGLAAAVHADASLARGTVVHEGRVTSAGLARASGKPLCRLADAIGD